MDESAFKQYPLKRHNLRMHDWNIRIHGSKRIVRTPTGHTAKPKKYLGNELALPCFCYQPYYIFTLGKRYYIDWLYLKITFPKTKRIGSQLTPLVKPTRLQLARFKQSSSRRKKQYFTVWKPVHFSFRKQIYGATNLNTLISR